MYKKINNKGITLIALVITIVILLVLAGIAMATLGGENGLLTKSKQAQVESTKAQRKEELQLKIMDLQTKIFAEYQRDATLEDFYSLILEDDELEFIQATYKVASTENVSAKYETINVLYKNYVFTIDSSLKITNMQENSNVAEVSFKYEIKEKTEVEGRVAYSILIKIQSDDKITKVKYGDTVLHDAPDGVSELEIDFNIYMNTRYDLLITTLNGKQVEKYINLSEEVVFENGNPKTEDYFSSFTNTNSGVMIYNNNYYYMYASYDQNWCLLHSTNPIDFSDIKQIVVEYIMRNDGNGILATLTSGIQKEYNDDVKFDISTSNSTRSNSDVSFINILDVSDYNENGYLKIKLSHDGGDWAHTAFAYISKIKFIYNN